MNRSDDPRIRVAIVGCGLIAQAHIRALQAVEGVEILAVCDRDADRAQRMARLAQGARVYDGLTSLLQDERPDAVHVLTPPATHAELTIQAMEAGCHVLVEKPMALSVQDADSMIAIAREKQVKLCTNHNYLFKPSVLRARQLVDSGAVGKVVHAHTYYGLAGEGNFYGGAGRSHWAWRLPGGVFTNFLPHLIYLELAFLKRVDVVTGVACVDSTEMSVVVANSDASGTMTISMRAKPYAKFVDIYCTKGLIHADLVRETLTLHPERRLPRMLSKAMFSLEESVQLASDTTANTLRVMMGRMKNMPELPILFREFYDCIRHDGTPPVPGEDGRRMVQVLEMVQAKSPALAFSSQAAGATAAPAEPRTEAERVLQRKGIPGRVLVTGASGFLGRHLVAALHRSGAEVTALVRDRSRFPLDLEAQTQVVCGDVRDPATLEAAMRGVALVYHCAAVTTNSAPWAVHYQTNVLGTKAVLEAALKAGVQRVIHVSSVIVYGLDRVRDGRPIDESAPYAHNPERWAHYMRSKIAADRLALELWEGAQLPVTVLRLGILYGPGGGRSIGHGLAQVGSLRLMIGNGRNLLPYTYVENAVDCLLLAAASPVAIGQTYNVVDEPQVTVGDSALLDAKIAGESLRLLPVPPFLLSLAASLLDLKSRVTRSETPPRLSGYVVRSACRNIRYDTTKARRELGWQAAVTLEEGLRRTVDQTI